MPSVCLTSRSKKESLRRKSNLPKPQQLQAPEQEPVQELWHFLVHTPQSKLQGLEQVLHNFGHTERLEQELRALVHMHHRAQAQKLALEKPADATQSRDYQQ